MTTKSLPGENCINRARPVQNAHNKSCQTSHSGQPRATSNTGTRKDSQGHVLAVAIRRKSLKPFKLFSLGGDHRGEHRCGEVERFGREVPQEHGEREGEETW